MEKNIRKTKTMIKTTKIIAIILGLFIVFFIGFINESNEYFMPEIGLKYPSTEYIFNRPDLPDDYNSVSEKFILEKSQKDYFKNHELNKKLGIFSPIICLFILQLFLSLLFLKSINEYNLRNFIVDVFLFLLSIFVLYVALGIIQIYFKKLLFIFIGILIINLIINFAFRNVVMKSKFLLS